MLRLGPFFGWYSTGLLDTGSEDDGSTTALAVITGEVRWLETEQLRIVRHYDEISADVAVQLTDLMRKDADLRVANKQTLLQLEDARAQLEQARIELEVAKDLQLQAKAAQLQAEEARDKAEASLNELQQSHQEQLEHIETLRSDLIGAVIDSAGPEEEELPAHAPTALVAQHYAPGTGGVDLRPALAGVSTRASPVQLCSPARVSTAGLERAPLDSVKYGSHPSSLNISPRALRNASPRNASSRQPSHQPSAIVELDVGHESAGGCCSVQ
eukprot:scaffold3070_cov133-Isochrysis_galbana.AAC.7